MKNRKKSVLSRLVLGSALVGLVPLSAVAGGTRAGVTKMAIITPAQTLQQGQCSAVTKVQAQNKYSRPSNVPKTTYIDFYGSSAGMRFFSDATCQNEISNLYMAAYTNTLPFYFKSDTSGKQTLVVATYDYIDGSQVETILAPPPLPVTPPTVPPMYGVTVDNIQNISLVVESLKNLSKKATARVVFDEGMGPDYYASAVSQIHAVSDVMGEIADSSTMKSYTLDTYTKRTQDYIAALGSNVDIWEIGNEINGEWLGNTPDVVAMMSSAYNVVKAAGKKTELTLYYNAGCYAKASNEMFTWVNANVPAAMKQSLDYVLISYYEDDCNGMQPDWPTVFQQLATIFPNSKIGFGECGTVNASLKASYLNRYYSMKINQPNYVGGYFWWYFYQDMVPYTTSLWNALNQLIIAN